jgi:superfamily II DNA helicase RecQ
MTTAPKPRGSTHSSARIAFFRRNEWVAAGEDSFQAFCVDYLEGAKGSAPGDRNTGAGGRRIDYREILPPEQFALFARLRDVRKEIAEADGVPVFTVFTNEQLAEIVKRGCRTVPDLRRIDGIGEARAGRHGERILKELAQAADAPKGPEKNTTF